MSEQKKPQAGEFWEWAGERLRIIGTRHDGRIVGENQAGGLEMSCHIFDMTHLPDCDSFEWQPETFPQWYLHESGQWGHIAYVCRDSKSTYFCVDSYGRKTEPRVLTWAKHHDVIVRSGGWVKITQAQAEARVKKPEPVDSPDDWVILDPVVYADFELRKGIDFINYGHGWDTVDGYDGTPIREFILHEKNQVRCRRRDLPPMPQKPPQRNYVRLWTHRTSGTVCSATDARYLKYPDIWTELKHDGTGFYLEDSK